MSPSSECDNGPPDLMAEVDRLADFATALTYRARFLIADLEFALDRTRGRVEDMTVTLMFQKDHIDATQWLASEVWSSAKTLQEKLDALSATLAEAAAHVS